MEGLIWTINKFLSIADVSLEDTDVGISVLGRIPLPLYYIRYAKFCTAIRTNIRIPMFKENYRTEHEYSVT